MKIERLRSNKGYTGIDISVAMIIILIFIPTIFGIIYNMQTSRSKTEREATAINIAVDILEIAKRLDYSEISISDIENNPSPFQTELSGRYEVSSDSVFSYTGINNERYKIEVEISNYYPDDEEHTNENDFVKKVKATVTYPTGKTTKSIDISTVLQNKL